MYAEKRKQKEIQHWTAIKIKQEEIEKKTHTFKANKMMLQDF